MSYIEHTLGPQEKVLCIAKFSWVIYGRAILSIFAMALLMPLAFGRYKIAVDVAIIGLSIYAAIDAVRAWWNAHWTEMVVTNRRVLVKKGFVKRHTAEMELKAVESVYLDQSFWGRLCNFGTVHAKGFGESLEHIHNIDNPVEIRNAISTALAQ